MKRLFQSLAKTSDGAFVIDGRHRIIFWNQAAEDMLGYTPEEVAGLQCYEILGGRDEQGRTLCQRFCRVAVQAEKGETLPTRDVFASSRSGEGHWLNVTTFAYTSSSNSIGQVIVHLFRDVTENKENQRFVNQVMSASERLHQNGDYQTPSATTAKSHSADLTNRESQVLEMLARGIGTSEIASTLVISQSTVRNHIQNVLGKLGVHSRLEAVAYVFRKGLIETNLT
jgi:PAS domain S-box-containing protein